MAMWVSYVKRDGSKTPIKLIACFAAVRDYADKDGYVGAYFSQTKLSKEEIKESAFPFVVDTIDVDMSLRAIAILKQSSVGHLLEGQSPEDVYNNGWYFEFSSVSMKEMVNAYSFYRYVEEIPNFWKTVFYLQDKLPNLSANALLVLASRLRITTQPDKLLLTVYNSHEALHYEAINARGIRSFLNWRDTFKAEAPSSVQPHYYGRSRIFNDANKNVATVPLFPSSYYDPFSIDRTPEYTVKSVKFRNAVKVIESIEQEVERVQRIGS